MRTTPPPRFDVAALFPALRERARQTVRLHPRRGPEPPPDASKLGGRFLWPADEPWPVCTEPAWPPDDLPRTPHQGVMVGVLQLRRAEFPELAFPGDADLFQLLWCPHDHEATYSTICRAFWRRRAAVTSPLGEPPSPLPARDEYLPVPCVLHPERVTEYPSAAELPEEVWAAVNAWQEAQGEPMYEYQLSVAPGTKLGGYVQWIQAPEVPTCAGGHTMEHLLTIDSAEFDGGTWPRWLAVEDAGAWGAPYTVRDAVQRAAGLMLGDMGAQYVFLCRACPDWPIATVFQCG